MNIPVLLTTKHSCFENYATRSKFAVGLENLSAIVLTQIEPTRQFFEIYAANTLAEPCHHIGTS